ncbi:hypothetical protein BLOT_006780 [Blomia tropicalis]|nr:hypothetical protein BLOT_006780 [Blomia tropicalis]
MKVFVFLALVLAVLSAIVSISDASHKKLKIKHVWKKHGKHGYGHGYGHGKKMVGYSKRYQHMKHKHGYKKKHYG